MENDVVKVKLQGKMQKGKIVKVNSKKLKLQVKFNVAKHGTKWKPFRAVKKLVNRHLVKCSDLQQ